MTREEELANEFDGTWSPGADGSYIGDFSPVAGAFLSAFFTSILIAHRVNDDHSQITLSADNSAYALRHIQEFRKTHNLEETTAHILSTDPSTLMPVTRNIPARGDRLLG